MTAIHRGRGCLDVSFFAQAWDTLNMPQRQRHQRQITLPWGGEKGQSAIRGPQGLGVVWVAVGSRRIGGLARAVLENCPWWTAKLGNGPICSLNNFSASAIRKRVRPKRRRRRDV